jgi:hypothetical protein
MVDPSDADAVPSAAEKFLPSIYFVLGQAGWFGCVISAAHGLPWMGALLTAALVTLHVGRVRRPRPELKLLAGVIVIGTVWESALVTGGLIDYPTGMVFPGIAPYWIVALWGLFAAQFNTTYAWLKTRVWAAAVLGAVAGPLSFRAGAALGALRFVKPWPAMFALAVGWSMLLPVLVLMSRRWDGVRRA